MKQVKYILILFLIIIIGMVLRIPPADSIRNIDEVIARDVVGSMQARKDFNSDWKLSESPLPHDFGRFRYNFSSYLISARIFTPLDNNPEVRLISIRGFNVFLFAFGALVLWVCAIELGLSRVAGLILIILFALSPGGVHDAHMARPETFLTVLIIVYVYACVMVDKVGGVVGPLLAGVALGLLVSTKFTLSVMVVLFLSIVFFSKFPGSARRRFVKVFIFFISIICGFMLGAPYGIIDVSGYFDGVNELRRQYYSLHIPHSYVTGGSTFLWQLEFFLKVYGLVFLSPFIYLIYSTVTRNFEINKLAISVSGLIFFSLVATSSVFFERNFSPVISMFALSGVFLYDKLPKWNWIRLTFIVLLFSPFIYWTSQIYLVQQPRYSEKIDTIELDLSQKFNAKSVNHVMLNRGQSNCGLVRQLHFSDPTSVQVLEGFKGSGWEVVASIRSPFRWLPTSTLHTYLAPNVYWLYKTCEN